MALADRTRLRLLNLMSGDEVCVNHFTEILAESQPKISRHLAYLRNSGLVATRRHGKWIYYSISWPANGAIASVLDSTLNALSQDSMMLADRARFAEIASGGTLPDYETSPEPHRESIYDPPSPVRPVHNDLDEFLL